MSARAAELIHVWNYCHACGAKPIVGLRYTCQLCPRGGDNDLCEACYLRFEQGQIQHPAPDARETPAGRHVFRAFEGVAREKVLPWLAVPWSTAPAPQVADRFVVRPAFRSGRESFFGSYGFIVVAEDGGQPLLVTALHVVDELAKFRGVDCSAANPAYTGRELPQHVTGVQLYDPYAPNWMLAELGDAGAMLVLPDARLPAEEPYSRRDIAAFRLAGAAAFQPARLAGARPAVGEPIWLAVSLRGVSERTIPALVVESTDETLIFRFAPSAIVPKYSSGAPLLDRNGEVAGINVGGGSFEGHEVGHGNHAASMRRHLGW